MLLDHLCCPVEQKLCISWTECSRKICVATGVVLHSPRVPSVRQSTHGVTMQYTHVAGLAHTLCALMFPSVCMLLDEPGTSQVMLALGEHV